MDGYVYKAVNGIKRTEREHDALIYEKSMELVKSHDLFFDQEYLIPSDLEMADRLYDAAINLLEDVGVFCIDTGRVIELSRKEIVRCIRNACSSFSTGENSELTQVSYRNVLDEGMPVILGGPTSAPISEELFIAVHRSYAKYSSVDSIAPGSINSSNVQSYGKGNPLVMLEGHNAVNLVKEACRLEGRSGISCVSPPFIEDTKTAISIANSKFMGLGDLQELYPLPDLKTDFNRISRALHYISIGTSFVTSTKMIMGTMTNAIAEQFAIEIVAELLKSRIIYSSPLVYAHPCSLQNSASRSIETLWASFMASMAVSRNSHLLHGIVINNSSGPCTESMMYETAVQTIGCVVCGADSIAGPLPNKGGLPDHAGGLDSFFMAKIAEIATSLSLDDANYLCMELYNRYAGQKPELGQSFNECYDLNKIEPSEEYHDIYDRVMDQVYDTLTRRFSK